MDDSSADWRDTGWVQRHSPVKYPPGKSSSRGRQVSAGGASASFIAPSKSDQQRPAHERHEQVAQPPGVAGCQLLRVARVEARPLNVPLVAPFTIATTEVREVRNVAIRLELELLGGGTDSCQGTDESGGCAAQCVPSGGRGRSGLMVGWGEAPTLPPVTFEDQPAALAGCQLASAWLQGRHFESDKWQDVVRGLGEHLPGHRFASVRAGMEMALLDAVAQHARAPLWRFFGGAARSVTTDITVAADESCRSPDDARRIAERHLVGALNIKLAKVGVLGALQVAAIAKQASLALMMGGMVETRLAMGFAAHLAAGLGGFRYIDLDTPLLLAEDPVRGGYRVEGPVYILGDEPGHGAWLDW
eukprot:jgi/Mesen1/2281/ME000154S01450